MCSPEFRVSEHIGSDEHQAALVTAARTTDSNVLASPIETRPPSVPSLSVEPVWTRTPAISLSALILGSPEKMRSRRAPLEYPQSKESLSITEWANEWRNRRRPVTWYWSGHTTPHLGIDLALELRDPGAYLQLSSPTDQAAPDRSAQRCPRP